MVELRSMGDEDGKKEERDKNNIHARNTQDANVASSVGGGMKFCGLRTGSRAKVNFGGGGKPLLLPPIAGATSISSGNSSNSASNTGSQRNSKSLTPPYLDGVGGLPLAAKRLVRAEANQLRACCSKKDLQSAATATTRRMIQPASQTTADTEPEMDNILEKALKKILREQVGTKFG